ncbi:hypothetical protein D516_2218 [Rhodobacter sp. AKP1]|nr:hypothetical protein D516_2218 [Rhodobacter sp. AKP1]
MGGLVGAELPASVQDGRHDKTQLSYDRIQCYHAVKKFESRDAHERHTTRN